MKNIVIRYDIGIDSLEFKGPGEGTNADSDNFRNILKTAGAVVQDWYDIGLTDEKLIDLFSETFILEITSSINITCNGFAQYVEKQSKRRSIMFGVTEGNSGLSLEQLLKNVPQRYRTIKGDVREAKMWNNNFHNGHSKSVGISSRSITYLGP
ncbi:hypothetical protein WR25_02046 [Diploscapter pachys]|uniref:Uncharacterized protein n=1 Tax=Diploscapter pachys TaxID=2018661 RepID=A0A2A2K9V2_9BILA|nr:hypothetical protein WR25_02046 [Diploscapter pachys]